jgi:hypothetical protein
VDSHISQGLWRESTKGKTVNSPLIGMNSLSGRRRIGQASEVEEAILWGSTGVVREAAAISVCECKLGSCRRLAVSIPGEEGLSSRTAGLICLPCCREEADISSWDLVLGAQEVKTGWGLVVGLNSLSPREEEISEQQKRPLTGATEGSTGALLRVHLGPVAGSLMYLSANGRGPLMYRC